MPTSCKLFICCIWYRKFLAFVASNSWSSYLAYCYLLLISLFNNWKKNSCNNCNSEVDSWMHCSPVFAWIYQMKLMKYQQVSLSSFGLPWQHRGKYCFFCSTVCYNGWSIWSINNLKEIVCSNCNLEVDSWINCSTISCLGLHEMPARFSKLLLACHGSTQVDITSFALQCVSIEGANEALLAKKEVGTARVNTLILQNMPLRGLLLYKWQIYCPSFHFCHKP